MDVFAEDIHFLLIVPSHAIQSTTGVFLMAL